jgi:DNA topoisomerase VI subunit B
MSPRTLVRKTFSVSRLAEFASQSELIKQTGHDVEDWPLVIAKEVIDNGLDEAEEAETAPAIEVVVDTNSIAVADNGRGIPDGTIASITDYATRTSSRAAYVSPTRGAQGNALQSTLPMGFALDGEKGETIIESRGVAHRILFTVNPVRRTPCVDIQRAPSPVTIGTRITVRWPDSACWILRASVDDFLQLVSTFGWLNPHLTLSCELRTSAEGEPARLRFEATDPNWSKWRPSMPTSPHGYDADRFSRLMEAEIAHAEDKGTPCPTVREFISSFRGLSATAKAKAICEAIGASRLALADFHAGGEARIKTLLEAMQAASKPVKPRDLGWIGRDHLLSRFITVGVEPDTFDYRMSAFEHLGLPYVIEMAFGYAPSRKDEGRLLVTGVNFSPAVGSDPFRHLGPNLSLDGLLANQWADRDEPVVVFVHLTAPRLNFLDKGKTQVALP